MTTAAENERLGVVETKVARIEADVAEIKGDVKTLIAAQTSVALRQAAEDAAAEAIQSSRRSTGVWVRFISERAIALFAAGVAIYAALKG